MKYFCLIILLLVTACGHVKQKQDKTSTIQKSHAADLLEPESISKLVAANHQKLVGQHGDFESFKKYINGLNDKDPASIPFALDYIETCISPNLAEKDSVLLLFNVKFYKVSNTLSDSLETKYANVLKRMEDKPNSQKPKALTGNLKACGIGIFSTEGNYYLDILPDYLYENFQTRVSDAAKSYLLIRKEELKKGFSEDAGMLISFDELYQRVKRWEKFLNHYPANVYVGQANDYYTDYLETLLTGMDNSRVFDMDSNILLPEVKTIYEKAIQEDPDSKTSQLISSYYNFLSRHDFKQTDSVDVFLKEHKLSTMLGVQPATR